MKRIVATILSLGFLHTVPMVSTAADSSNQRGEWEKTVEAAKKEGQLTVYHWGTPLMLNPGAFQKAYPEIKVTTVSAIHYLHVGQS